MYHKVELRYVNFLPVIPLPVSFGLSDITIWASQYINWGINGLLDTLYKTDHDCFGPLWLRAALDTVFIYASFKLV